MSSASEYLVAAEAVMTVVTTPFGLAAGLIGTGVYAAYEVMRQLSDDYKDTLETLRAGDAENARVRDLAANQRLSGETTALLLTALTHASPAEDAEAAFVRRQVQRLAETTGSDEFTARCQELLVTIDAAPREVAAHLAAYQQLCEARAAVPTEKSERTRLLDELALLHDEALSPLLDDPACAGTRALWLEQIAQLQALAARQPALARQGLGLLRQRLRREMQLQAERSRQRGAAAESRRMRTTDLIARCTAVARLPELPEQVAQANALLARISDGVVHGTLDHDALNALTVEVAALYAACEHLLRERLVSSYLGAQVSDVLLSMGYQVAQVASDDTSQLTYLAPVDNAHGVEFHISGTGRLTTEMVALSEEAVQTGEQGQEKVCGMVGQVMQELAARRLQVRERFRKHLRDGEPLKITAPPAEETVAPANAPVAKRLDEE